MINAFQRFLYILGTISPYGIITSICFGVRVAHSLYILIILILSVLLLIYHIFFLRLSFNNLPCMDFYANEAPKENDEFAKGFGFVYLIPIIEWILTKNVFDVSERSSGWFLLIIGCFAFLISLFSNKSYGSPVYLIMGYHFHTIQADGSKSYVLMSRVKHFRNKKQVRRTIRLFEDLLIDAS